MATQNNEILYHAIIWKNGTNEPGLRVSVIAKNLDEAQAKLEDQYGEGSVYYLRNEEDAEKPR